MTQTASLMSDAEIRMGLAPIEELLAERDDLIRQVADLRAKHGPFGTWGDLRKIQLSTIAQRLRAQAVANNTKLTEAALDDAAHADPAYVEFVAEGTLEKASWAVKEATIEGIDFTIQRGQAIARYLSAELGLSK